MNHVGLDVGLTEGFFVGPNVMNVGEYVSPVKVGFIVVGLGVGNGVGDQVGVNVGE